VQGSNQTNKGAVPENATTTASSMHPMFVELHQVLHHQWLANSKDDHTRQHCPWVQHSDASTSAAGEHQPVPTDIKGLVLPLRSSGI
jgi:hypothetical protein